MAVFVVVVLVRFLLPLVIPRYPLPAIIGCLVVDGVDQSIFQAFGYDPPGYQSYDKAMDVFYLALAYLATLRNWTSHAGLPGRAASSTSTGWSGWSPSSSPRRGALLLVFPNTFEYFFIAYEGGRGPLEPAALRADAAGSLVAAGIWIFIKLPQEYWIHVAQLDLTDTLRHAWAWPLLIGARPRCSRPCCGSWSGPRLPGAGLAAAPGRGPAPGGDGRSGRAGRVARRARPGVVLATLEKVFLVGLLTVIFAQTLPGTRPHNLQLLVGTGAFIVVNAALVLVGRAPRRRRWSRWRCPSWSGWR